MGKKVTGGYTGSVVTTVKKSLTGNVTSAPVGPIGQTGARPSQGTVSSPPSKKKG
jgi:hypothetical protein